MYRSKPEKWPTRKTLEAIIQILREHGHHVTHYEKQRISAVIDNCAEYHTIEGKKLKVMAEDVVC